MLKRCAITSVGMTASLLLASCTPTAEGEAEVAPTVTVATPQVEDVTVSDEVSGRFQAVETIDIRPQITGRLVRVHFTDGQMVRRGDVLFTIDPAEARAVADEARAARDLADVEFDRAERLRPSDAISEQEYVRQRQEALRLRAAARRAEVRLGFTQVRSPTNGRISDRRVDVGNVVVADETLLTRIVSQSPIHFEFSADPDLARRIGRPGPQALEITVETGGGDALPGRLDFLDNQVDPRGGVVRGRALVANADGRAVPGQFGRIRIGATRLSDAMLLPETAILADQTRRYVLVVNAENIVQPAGVTLGPVIDGRRVVEGLDPRARVILAGGAQVYPGLEVTPRAAPGGPGATVAAQGGAD